MFDIAPTCYKDAAGTHWKVGDTYHRIDGPALETSTGGQYWIVNGQQHRPDGPAVTRPDGSTYWYLDGQLHCVHGPAVTRANGDTEWWLHGHMLKYHNLDLWRHVPESSRELVAALFAAGTAMAVAVDTAARLR